MNSSIYGYLTVFHTIVSEGSIAGASRKLHIAPPSVSQSLKLLEQYIGLPLFHRTTRKMELTEAGTRLFESTQDAMQSLSVAVEAVQDLKGTPSGKLRMTIPRIAYWLLIKPHFAEFCQRYPDIELEIAIDDGTVDILQENFDLGIRFGDKVEENRVAKKLLEPFRLGLYVSPAYAKQYGIPKRIAELPQHKLINFRFTTSNRLMPLTLNNKGQDITVEMPSGLIANNLEVVMDAVRQGLGIGRVFEPIIAQQPDMSNFIPVLEQHWKYFPPLYLYYLQHNQKPARVRALIDFILEKAGLLGV